MGKIGLFDAGMGGLLLMRAIVLRLPTHDYVYLGDSGHAPYGNRTPDDIYHLTERGVNFLFSQDCDVVVVLCNTADSSALQQLQQSYPQKKLIGVVMPTVVAAARQSSKRSIGVIATEATVRSGAFTRELLALRPDIHLQQQACPMLVPLIESHQIESAAMQTLLKTYIAPLQQANIDTLILGCTHYSQLTQAIKTILGPTVHVVDEAPVIAEAVADFLARHPELERGLSKHARRTFFCTEGGKKSFDLIGSEFYGSPINVSQVTI